MKWCSETTATRGGVSLTLKSLLAVDETSRYPNSTGRVTLTTIFAFPALALDRALP